MGFVFDVFVDARRKSNKQRQNTPAGKIGGRAGRGIVSARVGGGGGDATADHCSAKETKQRRRKQRGAIKDRNNQAATAKRCAT